jgi:LysM repeat protein
MVKRPLVARYVAPAVFVLAVTVVVLLVRSSLRSDTPETSTTPAASTRKSSRPVPASAPARPPSVPKRYYAIRSGDTLDSIASRFDTTVTVLLALNPGVEPTALRPGQEVRIK